MSMPETYPMPLFVTLEVADMVASLSWYEAIGFTTVFAMPGPDRAPLFAHMRWIRYADVLLRQASASQGTKGLGIALNFMVEHDIDALAVRAKNVGAIFFNDIGDRPWNARDFTLLDPDGFALTFTFGPLKRREFDAVMRETFQP
ncbi:MAG: VOC family protein [Rhizomicrobium sp.]